MDFHQATSVKTSEYAKETTKKVKILSVKVNKHLNSFHALHSSLKMERLDYFFKFSTEIVVITFSLIIIGINAAGAHHLDVFNKNLMAKFLTYHPKQNLALYSKSTTIKTVVDKEHGGLIPSASAQVTLASAKLSTSASDVTSAQQFDTNSVINNNTIEKENPDSVRGLIAEQIKVYDTKQGDTLKSISEQFGISTSTIKWANNLPSDTIKPGWNLVILPTSGVLHKVTNNDTLPDIAKKYNADINQIISYNNLEDDSDINPGDLLIVPNGTVPAPAVAAKPKAAVKHIVADKVVYEPAPGGIEDSGQDHIFPWGQCTYWVAKKKGGIPWGGNANRWLANSKAYGAASGMEPVVGAIAVTKENKRYGHVAYVEEVDGDRFKISEMNYKGKGVVDERWMSIHDSVFISFIYW